MPNEIITNSSLATFRRCPRMYYLRYELRLQPVDEARALRFGRAYHKGLEHRALGSDYETALAQALQELGTPASYDTDFSWAMDTETLCVMLAAYFWRWSDESLVYRRVEQELRVRLRNPETGAVSRTFDLAGKLDLLASDPQTNGLSIVDHKTCGEDIGPDSRFRMRLRVDTQPGIYLTLARAAGIEADRILYDLVRKPLIKPQAATPASERKYTKAGVLYANQRETDEAPAQYADRLWNDIQSRPDFYFARYEVIRLSDDLEELSHELWQQAEALRESKRRNRWFRNPGRFNCDTCSFSAFCLNGIRIDQSAHPPKGFLFGEVQHPELGGIDQ